jgi:glycosyltransferase involved in cell wall biosynthesis
MGAFDWIVFAWGALASLTWCAVCLRHAVRVGRVRLLADQTPLAKQWPSLSVVIAACNEGDTIEPALASLLATDYPDLEVVIVDDRSTDATGEIVDRMARCDARIRAVHVKTLPDGWLGKVHALDAGVKAARGEWLLFTDADVHFEPATLRKAVARCQQEGLDHLTVLPDARSHSFSEEVVLDAVGELFMRSTRAALVGVPGSGAYAGVGAFNLVRRHAFDRTEGFSWLRMEVVDDVGLGLMLARSGARAGFAVGAGEVILHWYSSLHAMAQGLEKNMFGLYARFDYGRLVASMLVTWLVLVGATVPLVHRAVPWEWTLAAVAYASVVVYAVRVARRVRRPLLPLLLLPLGHLVVPLILLRSAVSCWRHDGIVWRGTTYSLAQLRAGQRVRL